MQLGKFLRLGLPVLLAAALAQGDVPRSEAVGGLWDR